MGCVALVVLADGWLCHVPGNRGKEGQWRMEGENEQEGEGMKYPSEDL